MKKILFAMLVLLTVSGCKSTHRAAVNADEYQSNYGNIVLKELNLPKGLEIPEQVRERYIKELTLVFNANGIKVFGPEVYLQEWNHQVEAANGFIDINTGKVIEDKYENIKKATYSALKSKYGIQSVLYNDVRFRKAYFGDFRAEWDGQSEPYELNNNDFTNFMSSLVVRTSGHIPAISLMVWIHDMQDKELYHGVGGIQLTAKLDDDNEFVFIPRDEILQDGELIQFSINEAFSGIYRFEKDIQYSEARYAE